MLTKADHRRAYKGIETVRLMRIENIRKLKDLYGSWVDLGKLVGQSDSFLVSLAGPNPRRGIGERLARMLESNLQLPSGWLDTKHKG